MIIIMLMCVTPNKDLHRCVRTRRDKLPQCTELEIGLTAGYFCVCYTRMKSAAGFGRPRPVKGPCRFVVCVVRISWLKFV